MTAATIQATAAVNQDHKKNNKHKNTRNILGNPSTQGKKTQQSFAIFSREDPPTIKP